MNNYLNISEETFDRIDRFLNDELSDAEKEQFLDELSRDEGLRIRLEEMNALRNAVEASVLKQKMDDYHSVFDKEPKKLQPKGFSFQWHHLLAAAIFIVAVGSYWLTAGNEERLFDAYFTPDPGLATPMSTNNNYEFYRGMVSYKQGHYNEAIERWELLLDSKPESDTLNYFVGVAYLADKDESKAIDYLKMVADKDDFVFNNEAAFYLALAYLKANDKDKAVGWLKKSGNKHSEEILNQILK
jgi:cytochrome c-type biogenesis protein CcmH/NrfG